MLMDVELESPDMRLWSYLKTICHGKPETTDAYHACLHLTGAPAANRAEALIEAVAGDGESIPLESLRQQISLRLYQEELRRGGFMLDIGVLGPAAFLGEVSYILAQIRPEFGELVSV